MSETHYEQLQKVARENFVTTVELFDGTHPCHVGNGECCIGEIFAVSHMDVLFMTKAVLSGDLDISTIRQGIRFAESMVKDAKKYYDLEGNDSNYTIATAVTLSRGFRDGRVVGATPDLLADLVRGRTLSKVQNLDHSFCPFFDEKEHSCKAHGAHPLICQVGGAPIRFGTEEQESENKESFPIRDVASLMCKTCFDKACDHNMQVPKEVLDKGAAVDLFIATNMLLIPVRKGNNQLRQANILDMPELVYDLVTHFSPVEIGELEKMFDEEQRKEKKFGRTNANFAAVVYENGSFRFAERSDADRFVSPLGLVTDAAQALIMEQGK